MHVLPHVRNTYIYIYIYTCIYTYVQMYMYTYIEREREREIQYGIITHIKICIHIYVYMHIYIYRYVYVEHICIDPIWFVFTDQYTGREWYMYIYIYVHKCIYMYILNILLSNYVTSPAPQPPHSMSPLSAEVMAWTLLMDQCLIVCHLTTLLACGVGRIRSL